MPPPLVGKFKARGNTGKHASECNLLNTGTLHSELVFGRCRKTRSMPPSFVGRPVALVIISILATVTTLVWLSSYMHVHNVLLHQILLHETFLAVFTLVTRLIVADMLVSHVDVEVFHLCSTYATLFSGVLLFLVLIQLMLVGLHLTTVRTLDSFRVMVSLKVTPQVLCTFPLEATVVTYLLVRLHVFLQFHLGLKATLASFLRAGQPSHVDHLHMPLLLDEPDCPRLD